jgi:hypothetical protein
MFSSENVVFDTCEIASCVISKIGMGAIVSLPCLSGQSWGFRFVLPVTTQ